MAETSGIDELFFEYRRTGDRTVRNQLVENHQGLAGFFARKYRNRGVPDDDLRQVALLALVKAVDRFDPEHGVQFSTFGGRTIDGELKRYFRDKTWAVRVPRRAQELIIDARRAVEELTHRLDRSPSMHEVAEYLDVDVDDVLEALDAGSAYRTDTFDTTSPDDAAADRRVALADREEGYGDTDNRLLVADLLATLPERERRIIELRFYERLSQSEIAGQVGVSQMHVSRLLRRTLAELRERM